MFASFRHLILSLRTPPNRNRDDDARLRALLTIIVLLLGLTTGCSMAGALLQPELLVYWPIFASLLAIILLVWTLVQRDRLYTASLMVVWGCWALITLACYTDTGLYSVTVIGYALVIVLAGMLLSRPWTLVISLASCLATFGMYLAWEAGGFVATASYFDFAFNVWVSYSAVFLFCGALMWGVAYRLGDALLLANRHSAALEAQIAELRAAEDALRRRESLLNEMGDLAGVGGWEIDARTSTLTWTREVFRIHDLPLDFQPTVEASIRFYAPESLPLIRAAVERALASGEGWDLELEIISASGRKVPVRTLGRAEMHDGGVTRVYGAFQDISPQRAAEAALREREAGLAALQVAQGRAEFLTQFLTEIGEITHDLKVPLSVINSSLWFLERPIAEGERQERIARIQGQTDLMLRYVQNILAISQLERAERLNMQALDLNALAQGLPDTFQARAQAGDIRLNGDFAAAPLPIEADDEQLYRAMANLVENAVNYTARGGQVTLRTARTADYGVFSVIDSGVGIAADELPLIFDRFFRGSNVRASQTGTGLGLAIVRKIAEMHGGRIEVSSAQGQGSTFALWLPLRVGSG